MQAKYFGGGEGSKEIRNLLYTSYYNVVSLKAITQLFLSAGGLADQLPKIQMNLWLGDFSGGLISPNDGYGGDIILAESSSTPVSSKIKTWNRPVGKSPWDFILGLRQYGRV